MAKAWEYQLPKDRHDLYLYWNGVEYCLCFMEDDMTKAKRKNEVDYEADRVLRWISQLKYSQVVVGVIGILAVVGIISIVESIFG